MKETFNKICIYYSYVLVFLTFMGQTFLKFSFQGFNFSVTRLVMLFVFILIPICLILNRSRINIKSKGTAYIFLFFAIWLIYSLLTIIWSLDIKMYIITNFYIVTGIANIFYLTFLVDVKKNYTKYYFIMQFAICINCLYYLRIKDSLIGGFYDNTNDLAVAITFIFPISLYMLLNSKKLWHVIYNVIFLIIYYWAFLLIDSRACILGISIGVFLMLCLVFVKNRKILLEKFNLKLISICLILFISVFMVNSINKNLGSISSKPIANRGDIVENNNSPEVIEGNKTISSTKNSYQSEDFQSNSEQLYSSNEIRTNLIFNVLYFLKQDCKLLTGIGTGNTIYYLKNLAKYSTNFEYSVHNFWLEILLINGVFIFVGYITFIIILVKKLLSKIDLTKKLEDLLLDKCIIYLLFILSFILSSISSSSMLTREWIWIVWGFILYYVNSECQNEKVK